MSSRGSAQAPKPWCEGADRFDNMFGNMFGNMFDNMLDNMHEDRQQLIDNKCESHNIYIKYNTIYDI